MEFNEIRKEATNKVLEIMRLINEGINLDILNDLDSIQYRIKSNGSIMGKMKKVGDNIYNVYDLIGIRYIFHNLKYYKKLKDYIVNNSNFEIVEIKNYLEDVDHLNNKQKNMFNTLKEDEATFKEAS